MVSILGANSVSGGYEVSNSLRLNQGDSPVLTKTFSSAGTEETFTWSGWVKRGSDFGTRQVFFGADNAENNNASYIRFTDDETIQAYLDDGNSLESNLNTSAKFRDVSAWYHIVWAVDTTQGTDTNRVKVYVNGVQLTDFQSPVYPPQNFVTDINAANEPHYVATPTAGVGNDYALDGYITEVNFVDGSQLTPTSFGEFDDNGVWKPIRYSGSYGTNGFFMEFKQTGTSQNASGIGADTSGNDNHFAVTNLAATDITEDTCTNNFATLNPLTQSEPGNSPTFAEGNLKITMANFDTESVMATMGVTKGKWYWEVKGGWTTGNWGFGIEKASSSNIGFNVGYTSTSYSFSQGGWKQHNSSASQIDSGLGNTDIIGYALDLDNGYFNFSQNGVWYNGSASESTTFDTSNHDFTSLDFGSEFVMPTISGFANTSITTEINFGNPTFSISSGNNDGKYGNFEYPPPSGYYALCTKRLAEFG